MQQVVIIGGGVIGLSTAWYLQSAGCQVTVIDKGDFLDNCSFGNAGYVCPSHFIPLATPGIVKQGLKWMFNSRSPFYVQPRLSRSLIDWGIKFIRSATAEKVESAAIPLRDVALLSQQEYQRWAAVPGFDFAYEKKGLLEIFQTEEKAAHAHHTLAKSLELGLDTVMLNQNELRQMEPHTRINALGALYFKDDAHLYPNKLMRALYQQVKAKGANLVPNQAVTGLDKKSDRRARVVTADGIYDADEIVIATGSWSRELVNSLGTKLPLVPGRGYSVTLEDSNCRVNHPAVLMEGRVAITPMDGNKIRFGGTMEITSTKTPPRYKRVEGILSAVESFYPDFKLTMPPPEKIWYGYRPCSADGLPYIGRLRNWQNVVVATGHAMIGLSLGAGTGLLVSEIVTGKKPSMDLEPFAVNRFG